MNYSHYMIIWFCYNVMEYKHRVRICDKGIFRFNSWIKAYLDLIPESNIARFWMCTVCYCRKISLDTWKKAGIPAKVFLWYSLILHFWDIQSWNWRVYALHCHVVNVHTSACSNQNVWAEATSYSWVFLLWLAWKHGWTVRIWIWPDMTDSSL